MRITVAPDSFKGSLDAPDVARAIAAGIRDAGGDHEIIQIPMADGGEGSLEVIARHWGIPLIPLETIDAIGRPCTAFFAIDPTGQNAVVEVAQASGLPMVSDVPLQPLQANTLGTGYLIRAALDAGVSTITLCLGGSATVDGGIGILVALGGKLLDSQGNEQAPAPENLARVEKIDLSSLHLRARTAEWILTVDVTNPLVGEAGAAAVFGPQKGASPGQVAELETGLVKLARLLEQMSGKELAELPGAGAAGGIPALIAALFPSKLVHGSELISNLVELPTFIEHSDLVISGEGRCDSQSAHGKVVSRVATLASECPSRPPVVVITGKLDCDLSALHSMGVTAAFSIANGAQSLDQLFDSTFDQIRGTVGNAVSLFTGHPGRTYSSGMTAHDARGTSREVSDAALPLPVPENI